LQLILAAKPELAQLRGVFGIIEVDGFEASTSLVRSVHQAGKKAVCYIDAGTWEKWRPDAKAFPAGVLGAPDAGWPGERWLDIRRQAVLLPIMSARVQMCARKGFDAVDPDNVNGVDNHTGFPLTMAQQVSYDEAIAKLAHARGMSVALKSFAAGASALQPNFDFVVDEECVKYHECGAFSAFVAGHKAVFDVEYTTSTGFCRSLPVGVRGVAKHLSLDAWARWCP
jgi:hypothetical protein